MHVQSEIFLCQFIEFNWKNNINFFAKMYEDKKTQNRNNEWLYSTIHWENALSSFSIKLYN